MSVKRRCKECGWCFDCTCVYPNVDKENYLPSFVSDEMMEVDAGKNCPWRKAMEEKTNPDFLINVLKHRFEKEGIKGAVVGISGGKDSTIVAKLMAETLGKNNVLGVLMPNGEQADICDSYRVVKALDIPYIEINIELAYKSLMAELNYNAPQKITNVASMNVPPRLRMTSLYAIAQSMGDGWRVMGTTNKSEEYIGWLTKWGDGAADFEPIIDYTVTELRELGSKMDIPQDLVNKVPIDGLAPGSDEERLGFTYEMLDSYIFYGSCGNKLVDECIFHLHENSAHKRNPVASIRF